MRPAGLFCLAAFQPPTARTSVPALMGQPTGFHLLTTQTPGCSMSWRLRAVINFSQLQESLCVVKLTTTQVQSSLEMIIRKKFCWPFLLKMEELFGVTHKLARATHGVGLSQPLAEWYFLGTIWSHSRQPTLSPAGLSGTSTPARDSRPRR